MHARTTDDVIAQVERLLDLAQRRWALLGPAVDGDAARASAADAPGPRDRARELVEHTRSYLLPRARDLDAPLIVVLLGSTGSGKSTLLNTIARAVVSRTGVLRPTTRDAVVLATAADAAALIEGGPLAAIPRPRFGVESSGARPGIVVIDAPDIDSVEHDNRALADTLLEVADLCLFVTTATRYADRVPWDVLERVEQRGLPLLVVVNRLPTSADDAAEVLGDVRRLLAGTRLTGTDAPSPGRDRIEVVGIGDGALDAAGTALLPSEAAPILTRIDALAGDREARRTLATQALAGAVQGITPLCAAIADDLERAAVDADRLRRIANDDHAAELRLLLEHLGRGTVLREEVVRQWHSFVGADQVTRMFSHGIGRVRGAVVALFRGTPPAPVTIVQQGATDDLTALLVAHASDAARQTAAHWSGDPDGALLVATDPALWSAAPDLPTRSRDLLGDWVREIAGDVAATGATKRGLARGLSLGVNAGAVTVMLGTFAHTGGVTGAEVGIAAATAFLNQKLLNAVFGEAAVQEMIERARDGLHERLGSLMGEECGRFTTLIADAEVMRRLAEELRAAPRHVDTPGPADAPGPVDEQHSGDTRPGME